jgi:hypothetical protein
MYHICFSILCHDNFDYVQKWIKVAQLLNPNCCWVFHISETASIDFVNQMKRLSSDCYINPNRLSAKPNQINADLSNWKFAQTLEFEYFSTDHITSFPFKSGSYDVVKNNPNGVAKNWRFTEWHCGAGQEILSNSSMNILRKRLNIGQNDIFKIQNEGMTLPRNNTEQLFDAVDDILLPDTRTNWVEQEYIYGTILNCLNILPTNLSPTIFYEAEQRGQLPEKSQLILDLLGGKDYNMSIPSQNVFALKKIDDDSVQKIMEYYNVS